MRSSSPAVLLERICVEQVSSHTELSPRRTLSTTTISRRERARIAPRRTGGQPSGTTMKLGLIVQRYGGDVLGGSEQLCRLVAERLAAQHEIEVLTTCARDYVTWRNEYPEGADRVRGVTIRRFANARTRDLASFNRFSEWLYNNPHSRDDEMEWLKQQGPWCPALIDYLNRHQRVGLLASKIIHHTHRGLFAAY